MRLLITISWVILAANTTVIAYCGLRLVELYRYDRRRQ